jgi:phosphopantothenoylcysteine decarboxylase/phosphopantothenate--cysteine ligase
MNARACHDRKILVGVTGGISCYKTCSLVSHLVQAGASVRVIMTESATKFVQPLTFEALSNAPVVTSVWQQVEHKDSQHVNLARWCDLFVVAPATADFIAKLAAGICDDIVSLSATALPRSPKMTPVILAPAMNAQMWENPVTRRNVQTVQGLLGYEMVGPADGWQACRTTGAGRMSEPDEIYAAVCKRLDHPV